MSCTARSTANPPAPAVADTSLVSHRKSRCRIKSAGVRVELRSLAGPATVTAETLRPVEAVTIGE